MDDIGKKQLAQGRGAHYAEPASLQQDLRFRSNRRRGPAPHWGQRRI